jgi:endonuclease YncB( thermonuclease family)
MGAAIVTNFSEQAADTSGLHQAALANLSQLQTKMQPVHNGHGTLVDLGHGDTLTVANVTPDQPPANSLILA